MNNQERGEIKGVYCLAYLTSGQTQFEYMTKEELDKIKGLSESYKSYLKYGGSNIWVDYESEMDRKTIIRRIFKYLPKSNVNTSRIDKAIQLDESAFEASMEQITYIEGLLSTSDLHESEKERIESEFVTMTSSGANKCIEYLLTRQLPPSELTGAVINETDKTVQNEIQKQIDLDN